MQAMNDRLDEVSGSEGGLCSIGLVGAAISTAAAGSLGGALGAAIGAVGGALVCFSGGSGSGSATYEAVDTSHSYVCGA